MPAEACANHPKETTYVRCARCDTPICVRCMVDTPVGKKCRACSHSRSPLAESSPRQALTAFLVAAVVAVPARWMLLQIHIPLLAFIYGWLVGEAALWAGQRRRSRAMQVAAGLAALAGGLIGGGLVVPSAVTGDATLSFSWLDATQPFALLSTAIGIAVAVMRVRSF